MTSTDPFVNKKIMIQTKITETKSHITNRAELLEKSGKGSVDTVKASAAIRKDLKELEQLKEELKRTHADEERKAIKKARSKPGGEEVVRQNIAKRDEILTVIQENIDELRFQERNAGAVGGGDAGGGPGREKLMSSRQPKSRPKPRSMCSPNVWTLLSRALSCERTRSFFSDTHTRGGAKIPSLPTIRAPDRHGGGRTARGSAGSAGSRARCGGASSRAYRACHARAAAGGAGS